MAATLPFRDTLPATSTPTRPRPGTVAAGVVAVVILLGAGAVALSGGASPSAVPMAGPVAPAPAGPARSATAPPVDLPPTISPAVADGPLLVAPRVDWQLFVGVPLPYSKTGGPLKVDGPVYSGYQRSQTGALIAAAQLGTRYLLTPGDGWRELLERQVLPGVGRDTFARLRATVDQDSPPGSYGQPPGSGSSPSPPTSPRSSSSPGSQRLGTCRSLSSP
jgi:hypothetical protein